MGVISIYLTEEVILHDKLRYFNYYLVVSLISAKMDKWTINTKLLYVDKYHAKNTSTYLEMRNSTGNTFNITLFTGQKRGKNKSIIFVEK